MQSDGHFNWSLLCFASGTSAVLYFVFVSNVVDLQSIALVGSSKSFLETFFFQTETHLICIEYIHMFDRMSVGFVCDYFFAIIFFLLVL